MNIVDIPIFIKLFHISILFTSDLMMTVLLVKLSMFFKLELNHIIGTWVCCFCFNILFDFELKCKVFIISVSVMCVINVVNNYRNWPWEEEKEQTYCITIKKCIFVVNFPFSCQY